MEKYWEPLAMGAVMFVCSFVFTNLHYGMGFAGILISLGLGSVIGTVGYHRAGEDKLDLLRPQAVAIILGSLFLVAAGFYLHLG